MPPVTHLLHLQPSILTRASECPVSTHFANVHTPTEIEMETLQQYGFVAADFTISKTQGADLAAVANACFQQLIADVAA